MDIAGYTYRAANYCPACIVDAVSEHGIAPGNIELDIIVSMSAEDALSAIADAAGIDRMDEWTFDSDIFPKAIFSPQIEDSETCVTCGGAL